MKKNQAQIKYLEQKNEEYEGRVQEGESSRAQLDHLVVVAAM